ncbi:disease resistance protein RPM1-like [Camellia sinensis]|uniref:disease resistance protein RPM1-like n=1 Tax=Camellia sinensis TaxID=4442 RepID=UPI00103695B2|nr:disease resistance protein RPM1-like [Camellia sinensis]
MEWLVQGGLGLKAISVVGTGGLGKTTLVKKVYDAAAVKKHFNSHAWLTVLESFGVEDLLKDMCDIPQMRYVVVFDDVWNVNAWEAIKHVLSDYNCGSRVILTTRFAHIASTCCEETDGHVYTLILLSQEESWTLFCNKTFRGNLCPPNLKQISHRILKRCEGLPLAIVAISGLLDTKDKSRMDE